ncbi:nucleoside-diphosphate kinase [bacterium]|nr:nucleoside-diphosphate kinase [bacterium]
MNQQRTLIILKPDAFQRRLLGTIISRIEQKGLQIIGMKLMKISRELAERHYGVHRGKPFFDDVVSYITSGQVIVMAVEGQYAISVVRTLVGATKGYEAAPGTIRGDFGISIRYNLIHASDSEESASTELGIFFSDNEIVSQPLQINSWIQGE